MIEVERDGLTFRLDPSYPVQAEMVDELRGDGYETSTSDAIRSILKAGDHAVDVGAHVGILTCLMAQCVGPTGRVDAFEPHPENRRMLEAHVALNGLTNVVVHAEAVGANTRTVTLYECADNDGGHAIWNPGLVEANDLSRKHPKAFAVPMICLDDVIPYPVRLIKSDTEGNDFAVMQGAKQLILQDHPAIITEIHRFGMRQVGGEEFTYRRWLEARGYSATLLGNQGQVRPLSSAETVLDNTVFNLLFT